MRRYGAALPLVYQDQVPPSSAVSDLERLETAENSGRIEIKLNAPYGDDGSHQHIKLFLKGRSRPLSAVLPVFENLGLTVLSEQPFKLIDSDLQALSEVTGADIQAAARQYLTANTAWKAEVVSDKAPAQ